MTQPAEAQIFTVHELTLGGSQCKAEAISNGRAVGWATTPGDAEIHAFAWTEPGGMIDLGTLGGTRAEARAVDGDRVVGFSFTSGDAEIHAFSWTPTTGMRDLGTLGGTSGAAFGVSGGEVVGESTTASGEIHAFRWTVTGGMVDLGTLSGGTQSSAFRVHQGLVAGWSTTSGDAIRTRRPVAWNAAGEIIDIVGEPFDLLSGGFVRGNGQASDVRDGMVVGYSRISTPDLEEHAFAWTPAGGKVDLGTLPGDNVSSAWGTSAKQVVGFSSRFQGGAVRHPFSWTAAGGMIDLGTLGGDAEATHVNGGKVVGWFVGPDGLRAFLWTASGGMVDVTPPDFTAAQPVGIDAAGRIAVTHEEGDIGIARSAVLVFGSQDADGDGVPNTDDHCPNSIVDPTVVIDGCDSGVPNTIFPIGCTISDLIGACAEGASNHGQFVSCVSHLTNDLKKAGTITGQQKGAIQSCAAKAHIP